MSWITENPWPLLILLAGAAIVSLILGDAKGRLIALAFVLIAIGVYFLESAIVTPAEEVERSLQTMLEGFLAEDLTSIHSHIADDAPGLKEKAKQGLELVSLGENFHMQDIVVTVASDHQTAEAELRANGTLTIRHTNTPTHAATRWRTQWTHHRDGWKLSGVQRLHPMNGNEIGVLDPQ